MPTQPKAILFDLDNTLTDRHASITKFARQFYRHFRARHQMTRVEDIEPIIHNADGGGYRPLEERWRGLQKWIPWKDKPSIEDLRDYWYSELGLCVIGVVGLEGTLQQLLAKDIRLGIITNGPTGLQNLTIDTLNIRHHMSCTIVSETAGIKKPAPEIFHIALSELGLDAGDVWFVGDNPATDMLGAYQMEMGTVWKRGHHEWHEENFQPDYIVDNISEILSILG